MPVLRNADELSFADIEKNIKVLVKKLEMEKLTIEDFKEVHLQSLMEGIYGSMLSTPILNPPQSAVLGMHNIVERPVVIDGNVE